LRYDVIKHSKHATAIVPAARLHKEKQTSPSAVYHQQQCICSHVNLYTSNMAQAHVAPFAQHNKWLHVNFPKAVINLP